MKEIYLVTDSEENHPIGTAETFEGILEVADDYYGATEEYKNSGKRLGFKVYEYKYGGESLYGCLTYETQIAGETLNQKAFIWELEHREL
jgi:hypothetical protein